MSKEGRGLICAPITEQRADELDLQLMVNTNTALHETPFTVSIDLLGHGCTTGISAQDRAKTVQALINPATKPSDLGTSRAHFPTYVQNQAVYYAVQVIPKLPLTLPVLPALSLPACW